MFFVLASEAHDVENNVFANTSSSEELKSNQDNTAIKLEDELQSEINNVIDDENKSIDKEVKESSNDDVQIDSEESNNNNGTNTSEKMPRQNIKKITCLPNKGINTTMINEENKVIVFNGTSLVSKLNEKYDSNVTNRTTPGVCTAVMFYATWCPFSAKAAPHYNALARMFPDIIFLAADIQRHQAYTTQFGVLALPTILLFHNSKTIVKFNHSDYELANFTTFLNIFTGLDQIGEPLITDTDYEGPMPTIVIPETDYYLYLSWVFVIFCTLGYFTKSPFCQNIIETIRNNWREAEIQHEHID